MAISREKIDADAEKVLRRLRRYGHSAYLVGGCVRDLLLGRSPKDFDVATSATPAEIKDLFRNCRIIGRRFRLAHIFFGTKIIETSTFRTNPREGMPVDEEEELLIRRDNVFGTAEEDARRRDFTINGLFYDIEAGEVIDYVGGLADLEARLVRTIGDPDIRFREDPVRILRAIKFAARLGFALEPETYAAILEHRAEIPKCAAPRVLEEIYRLLREGAARRSMELLLETGVAATLAPELAWRFGGDEASAVPPPGADAGEPAEAGDDEAPRPSAPLHPPHLDAVTGAACRAVAWRVLDELDASLRERAQDGWQPTNATLLALLVEPFLLEDGPDEGSQRDHFTRIEDTLRPVVMRVRASRRDAERARQILIAQKRLRPSKRRKSKPMALVRRDYFLEALTVYELMARATREPGDESGDEISRWYSLWRKSTGAAPAPPATSETPAGTDGGEDSGERRRRRRRRGGRRRRRTGAEGSAPDVALAAEGGGDAET